jgi:hypothetical protein
MQNAPLASCTEGTTSTRVTVAGPEHDFKLRIARAQKRTVSKVVENGLPKRVVECLTD